MRFRAKQLEKELAVLLKGTEMEGFCFEIVKNCSGTLVSPNIPSGHRIDSKLWLKSIALTGCIYIRLLPELPDEGTDDILSHSVFDRPENRSTTGVINTSASATSTSTSTTSTVTATITVDPTDLGDAGTPEVIQCLFDINSVIDTAKSQNLHDPIELGFCKKRLPQEEHLN